MTSPDLRKARSIADGKIMLVPSHVEIVTPSDSGSASSSSSEDDDSSTSDSSENVNLRKKVNVRTPLRSEAFKTFSAADRQKSKVDNGKPKQEIKPGQHRGLPQNGSDNKQQTEAEANWTRHQFAQVQLANHLANKQQRIGSAKRVAEADARRRAEKHPLSAPSEARAGQFSVPKPAIPAYSSKLKRLNGDADTTNSLAQRANGDTSAAKRNEGELHSAKDGNENGAPWHGSPTRARPQRVTGAGSTPYALVKRIAARTNDGSDRLAQLERHIREQLGTTPTPSTNGTQSASQLDPTLNQPQSQTQSVVQLQRAASASMSSFRSVQPPIATAVSSSSQLNGLILVDQLNESIAPNSSRVTVDSSASATSSAVTSGTSATQLARPTVRRPCLASLPTPFASARSLLHSNGLLSAAPTVPSPNASTSTISSVGANGLNGYTNGNSSANPNVQMAPEAPYQAPSPLPASSTNGSQIETPDANTATPILTPPKVAYRTAYGTMYGAPNGTLVVDGEVASASELSNGTQPADISNGTTESTGDMNSGVNASTAPVASASNTSSASGSDRRSLESLQFKHQLPSPLSGSVASTTQQSVSVALSLVNGWQATKSLPLGGIVRERPLSPTMPSSAAAAAAASGVSAVVNDAISNLRLNIRSQPSANTRSPGLLRRDPDPSSETNGSPLVISSLSSPMGVQRTPRSVLGNNGSLAPSKSNTPVAQSKSSDDTRAPLTVTGGNVISTSRYSVSGSFGKPPLPSLPANGKTGLQASPPKPTTNGVSKSRKPGAEGEIIINSTRTESRPVSMRESRPDSRPETTDFASVTEFDTNENDEDDFRADSDDDELSDVGRDQEDGDATDWDDRRSTRSAASLRSVDVPKQTEAGGRSIAKETGGASATLDESSKAKTNEEKRGPGATKKPRTRRPSVGDDPVMPEDTEAVKQSVPLLNAVIVRTSNGEQPGLIQSRFAYMPVVLRFVPEGEQVEKLSWEVRKVLKWRMSTITPVVVKKCVMRSGFRITKKAHEWLGCFGRHMRTEGFKAIRRYQKFNHFPGSFQIGRKDRLWRNVHRMQNLHGRSKGDFDFVPDTFVLPDDYEAAKAKWEEQEQSSIKPIFIMKPPAAARGRGIKVVRKWADVPKKRPLVVQNYLRNPFLINGYKFDLRIYVYVSSIDPLRIYVHRDGLVRFASARFSLQDKSLKNRFAHLTNYSVNCQNKDYRPNKDNNNNSEDAAANSEQQSHKWSLKAFWSYLRRNNVRCDTLWPDIKQIVVKTILSAETAINSGVKANLKRRYCVHELFGFDIIVDNSMRPWLLECNISPSLHSDSPLDVRVKSHMIADMFNVAGFQIPDSRAIKPLRSKYVSRYQVDGGDPDDYQAMLVSAPQTVSASDTSANTTRQASANAKEKEDSSSSSSESEADDAEDETDRPFYVTDKRISTRKLSLNERNKHIFYCQNYQNEKIMETILNRLTPDDVYILCEMIDEFSRVGEFDIAFPTAESMSSYFRYFEQPRYYNLLACHFLKKFNTEAKLEQAIAQLNSMCKKKIHLAFNLSPNSEHFWVSPMPLNRLGY